MLDFKKMSQNMKNFSIYKLIFKGILILPLFWGCDRFLEEIPDNRVELNNLQKASQLLTSGYSSAGYNFTEWMGDNVGFTYGTMKLAEHNESYIWADFTGIFQDTPTYFWNSSYEAIAHANEVLAVIDNLPGDDARRKAVKGEALLIRAYNHFMIVNLFAKHYDQRTSNRDLGIPYVEEPEKVFIKQYNRLMVREVYQKIERDLLEGLELVNDSYYANSGKYHFTRKAALAFASRYYLFKGDHNNCVKYSSQLLGNTPEVYVKNIPSLLRERVNTEDYTRLFTSPNDESNLLLIRKITNFHVNVGHWPTDDTNELNPDFSIYAELRSNPFGVRDERFENAMYVRGENGLASPKFEFLFERSSLTSNVGLNYTIVLAFRGEEVLLNRAESNVLLNRVDDALADLQILVNRRYTDTRGNEVVLTADRLRNYYGVNDPRLAIWWFILHERQKEFIHEGLRWFDIKRYEFPVFHLLSDGEIITLDEEDPRKILQIPKAAIDVGGLEPNPR
jgi:starch-binding outer membrane protein, SusD/RagB family